MTSLINSNENSIFEFAKRSIYSFQVLIVGIAIPFLFLLGISNSNQKKINANQVKEVTTVSNPQSNNVLGIFMPKI